MFTSTFRQDSRKKRLLNPEAVNQRCSAKNMFLKISQISQENTCVRVSFLIKLLVLAFNFIKKDFGTVVFL